ncbi:MAG: pantetheine-phosphate adenylyltransferase [Legionellales bacterium]|nr:pantetheine-phosphate adenylyltransferase [Legionellales bacterium]|tara:strand:- start:5202 stop:5681 length:480 start_codon:yes stop_codon:yes gene_type:complete
MTTAIYPGSFDPITNGHVDIAYRAAKLFDKLIIAVAEKKSAKQLFTLGERVVLIEDVFSNNNNIEVVPFKNLVTDLAREKSANIIVRGMRTVSDFDYEFKMAVMNKKLHEDIETVFFNSTENFSYISSSLIREIVELGGDVSSFVPKPIELILKEKFTQ